MGTLRIETGVNSRPKMGTQARLKWVRRMLQACFLRRKIMYIKYIKWTQKMSSRTEMGTEPA